MWNIFFWFVISFFNLFLFIFGFMLIVSMWIFLEWRVDIVCLRGLIFGFGVCMLLVMIIVMDIILVWGFVKRFCEVKWRVWLIFVKLCWWVKVFIVDLKYLNLFFVMKFMFSFGWLLYMMILVWLFCEDFKKFWVIFFIVVFLCRKFVFVMFLEEFIKKIILIFWIYNVIGN